MGFFSWEATWGRVLTLDQLKCWKRVLANRCYLCEEDEETIEHLLVHCKKAKMLWDLFLLIVGTNWVFPRSNSGEKTKKNLVGGLSLLVLDFLARKE